MNVARTDEDLEGYRLNVSTREDGSVQFVRDPHGGVDLRQTWKRKKHLGDGGFGKVWQEAWEDDEGDWHYRAVKACSERKMRAAQIDYKRELLALAAFSRSEYAAWFVNLHGWWRDSEKLFVAMDYHGRGDLSRYARNQLSEPEIREIAENVARGLEVMHTAGFAHRDIKPENILVVQKRPEFQRWWVKIADFGMSKHVDVDSDTALHTIAGTRLYCAPEILDSWEQHSGTYSYSNKVDMWSFGCVLFNLGSWGHVAFSERELWKYCDARLNFNPRNITIHLSEQGKSLVQALLQVQPTRRLTATEVLQHPWLSHRSDSQSTNTSPSKSESQTAVGDNFNSFLDSTLSAPIAGPSPNISKLTTRSWMDSNLERTAASKNTVKDILTQLPTPYNNNRTVSAVTSSPLPDNKDKEVIYGAINTPIICEQPKSADGLVNSVPGNAKTSARGDSPQHSKDQSVSRGNTGSEVVVTEFTEWLKVHDDEIRYDISALHLAAKQGRLDIVKILIQQDADIDEKSENGWTSLHYAVSNGHLVVAQWLVEQGADIHEKSKFGRTSLHIAVTNGSLAVARWLVEQGADIHEKSTFGRTSLQMAAMNGHLAVARWLVEQGADIHRKDGYSRTLLHLAAMNGHLVVAQWLVEQGANIHERDEVGETPRK